MKIIIVFLFVLVIAMGCIKQESPKMWYRVSWYNKADTAIAGHGQWKSDSLITKAWADYGNKNYPELYHFIEMKSDTNETTEATN